MPLSVASIAHFCGTPDALGKCHLRRRPHLCVNRATDSRRSAVGGAVVLRCCGAGCMGGKAMSQSFCVNITQSAVWGALNGKWKVLNWQVCLHILYMCKCLCKCYMYMCMDYKN